eukprot:6470847-Amphidinium_carterae.1
MGNIKNLASTELQNDLIAQKTFENKFGITLRATKSIIVELGHTVVHIYRGGFHCQPRALLHCSDCLLTPNALSKLALRVAFYPSHAECNCTQGCAHCVSSCDTPAWHTSAQLSSVLSAPDYCTAYASGGPFKGSLDCQNCDN